MTMDLDALKSRWTDERALWRPGLSPAELDRFERQHGVELPDDMRAFYAAIDGMEKDSIDDHNMNVWFLDRVRPIAEVFPESLRLPGLFVFADWAVEAVHYAVALGEGPYPVGSVVLECDPSRILSESFGEFVTDRLRACDALPGVRLWGGDDVGPLTGADIPDEVPGSTYLRRACESGLCVYPPVDHDWLNVWEMYRSIRLPDDLLAFYAVVGSTLDGRRCDMPVDSAARPSPEDKWIGIQGLFSLTTVSEFSDRPGVAVFLTCWSGDLRFVLSIAPDGDVGVFGKRRRDFEAWTKGAKWRRVAGSFTEFLELLGEDPTGGSLGLSSE